MSIMGPRRHDDNSRTDHCNVQNITPVEVWPTQVDGEILITLGCRIGSCRGPHLNRIPDLGVRAYG